MKPTHALFDFRKSSSKRPTTKTAMAYLRRSYLIENFRIGTTSKILDNQRIYLWMRQPYNQVLRVAPHQGKQYIYVLLLILLDHNLNKDM